MSLQAQLIKKGLISQEEADKIQKEEELRKEQEAFKQQSVQKNSKPKSKSGGKPVTEAWVQKKQQRREFLNKFNRSRLNKAFEYGYWLFREDFSKVNCQCALCGKPVKADQAIESMASAPSTDVKMDELLRNRKSLGHILAAIKDVDPNRIIRLQIEGYEPLSKSLACIECLVYHLSNKKYFIRPANGIQSKK